MHVYHILFTGNRPHPTSGKLMFGENDPRLVVVVAQVDPRIHFALVCGAKVKLGKKE